MFNWYNLVWTIQVLAALVIIGLVLLQHGKGADMGAAFGSGASGSLFGATGSSNFLSKSTGIAAALFFATTLGLAFLGNHMAPGGGGGVMDNQPVTPISSSAAKTVDGAPAASSATTAASTTSTPVNQIPK